MQKSIARTLAAIVLCCGAYQAFAQNYPTAKPKPKPSASRTASPSPAATPAETPGETAPSGSASPLPSGPLKMISTDGSNKKSPIRVTQLDYYDEGYGSKYNSEVRLSGAVQNTGKKELKKVVVHLQVVDGDGKLVQEWKENPGVLKPGQTYRVQPAVWRNSLGTMLKAKMVVDHEEVVEKDGAKGAKEGQ